MATNVVALGELDRHPWSWKLGRLANAAMRLFGTIARKLKYPALDDVPVSATMLSPMAVVHPEQRLEDVAHLLVAGRAAHLPVIDRGQLVGVVTRDGIAAALAQSGPHARVATAPCHHVITVSPADALSDVLARLREVPDAVAVVLDHGAPVGLVTADHLDAYLRGAKEAA